MSQKPAVWEEIIALTDGKKMLYNRPVYVTKGLEGSLRWLIARHADLTEVLPKLRGAAALAVDLAKDLIFGRPGIGGIPSEMTRTHTKYKFLIDEKQSLPMNRKVYRKILHREGGRGFALTDEAQWKWVAEQPRRRRDMFPPAEHFSEMRPCVLRR